jgi:hypothetical protein
LSSSHAVAGFRAGITQGTDDRLTRRVAEIEIAAHSPAMEFALNRTGSWLPSTQPITPAADDSYVNLTRRSAPVAPTRPIVNKFQRAHLSVLAAGIEDTIVDIEHFIDPDLDRDSVLTHYAADLPPDFADCVRPILDQLRDHVAVFSERFSLEPRWVSRVSSVEAHVSEQIVRLDESGVKQLRGYDAVAAELGAVLAPTLEEFRRRFAEIRSLLHHTSDGDQITEE